MTKPNNPKQPKLNKLLTWLGILGGIAAAFGFGIAIGELILKTW